MFRPPPRSPLFPSTPLFRSACRLDVEREPRPPYAFGGFALTAAAVSRDFKLRHRRALRGGKRDLEIPARHRGEGEDRKSTRLNSSHANISYAVFCLKKKKKN